MKLALLAGSAAASWRPQTPFGFESQEDFDFPETPAEIEGEWSLADRCGQAAKAGSPLDQRLDKKCPNIILMNTDDMSWADVTLNNPSKQMPTPNIDRLVSKGVNFRDGHSCTSRCAPSRYCLMSGRYHFRRGDYHYKPMDLEYGRKVLPHLFKRNNYFTMTVGKPQPVEDSLKDPKRNKDYYFEEGTRYWGFDKSFSSRSYCCLPGGGYFKNDLSVTPFDRYSVFMDFRLEDEKSVQIKPAQEDVFWSKEEHWHLLDGYTEGGPEGTFKPSTYAAYWKMIDNKEMSELNASRRRRTADGKLILRHSDKKIRRRRRNFDTEKHINEMINHRYRREKGSYVRFTNDQGQVLIAQHQLQGMDQDRVNYEFAVDKLTFPTIEAAQEYLDQKATECENSDPPTAPTLCEALRVSKPKKTQVGYDSRLVMQTFRNESIAMINDHVRDSNPQTPQGEDKAGNRPFFMYLSWRAPHRPMSHDWKFDPANPEEHMPYVAFGKPGEQLGIFDQYVGDVMRTLELNDIAENTLVLFTSDNGPDGAGFQMLGKMGHLRMSTLRGSKASVYEGGHRVPFLSWWPAGIAKGLYGTNYDLPVSQTDFFATFADILGYPLPSGKECIYGFDSSTAMVHGRDATQLGRKVTDRCNDGEAFTTASTTTTTTTTTTAAPGPGTTSAATTLTSATTTAATEATQANAPGADWAANNAKICESKRMAQAPCAWQTCDECREFWTAAKGDRKSVTWLPNKFKNFCNKGGIKCAESSLGRSVLPPCHYTSSGTSQEYKRKSFGTIEPWQTHEVQTGFLLGWRGCMAEDSHSFKGAFEASVVESTETHDRWEADLKSVESKIFAGKLGDLSLRLGRYKLVRYNAPKDIRAGPTRQHLTDHHGEKWLDAPESARCEYDLAGNKKDESCSVEPQCRDFSTFDQTFCMRDHYYELWDLEKNFGEKVMCENSGIKNMNIELEEALMENGKPLERMATLKEKVAEKSTDPWGYTLGRELTPIGVNVNDCCLLNLDEKERWTKQQQQASGKKPVSKNPCENIEYRDHLGNVKKGGICKKMKNTHFFFRSGKTDGSLAKFRQNVEAYVARRSAGWKWGDAHFSGFDKFNDLTEDEFKFNWGCSLVNESKPAKENKTWVKENGEWREASMGDKYCIPPSEDDEEEEDNDQADAPEFQVGCKVADHNGPLRSGWEVNHQWDQGDLNRRSPNQNAQNGALKQADFGELLPFAECMASVLKIIEGAAYRPEAQMDSQFKTVFLDRKPIDDNGAGGVVSEEDDIIAGAEVGASQMHRDYIKALWSKVAPNDTDMKEFDSIGYHGAGSRYFSETRLAERCADFLPGNLPRPEEIKPNFDVNMNLLGWYDSQDDTGGQNTWLPKEGPDDRKVQKYYKPTLQGFLHSFKPQFAKKNNRDTSQLDIVSGYGDRRFDLLGY